MQLEYSTWCEVENYLKSRTDIIIPIGSTEQHGPMGLIGTDSICPEVLAMGISERKNKCQSHEPEAQQYCREKCSHNDLP